MSLKTPFSFSLGLHLFLNWKLYSVSNQSVKFLSLIIFIFYVASA